MEILRAKLYERESAAAAAAESSQRRAQVGSGDRSEKIRTYNYKDNRVTDHRIGLTVHSLDRVLEGDLEGIIDALVQFERAEQLANA
jgi:peptide chain release factor 1